MSDVAVVPVKVGVTLCRSSYVIKFEVFYSCHPTQRSNAVERWGSMRETTVNHFKLTPRTTAYAILWAGIVPFGLYSLIKWHVRRKDRLKGIEPRKHL